MAHKKLLLILWFIVLAIVGCFIWYPVWWGIIRLGIILGVAALWFGGLDVVHLQPDRLFRFEHRFLREILGIGDD